MSPKHSAMDCRECLDTKFVQNFREKPNNLKYIKTMLFIRIFYEMPMNILICVSLKYFVIFI